MQITYLKLVIMITGDFNYQPDLADEDSNWNMTNEKWLLFNWICLIMKECYHGYRGNSYYNLYLKII